MSAVATVATTTRAVYKVPQLSMCHPSKSSSCLVHSTCSPAAAVAYLPLNGSFIKRIGLRQSIDRRRPLRMKSDAVDKFRKFSINSSHSRRHSWIGLIKFCHLILPSVSLFVGYLCSDFLFSKKRSCWTTLIWQLYVIHRQLSNELYSRTSPQLAPK